MTPATDGPLPCTNRLQRLNEPVFITAPELQQAKPSKSTRIAVIALVLLGVTVRLIPLVQDRNLWIDEAMLALNLVERSPRQLLGPLDWNQGAPVGFLLFVKGAITAFGPGEWTLRLVPLVGSILGLVAFAWLARRVLEPSAALIAVGLFAVSPYLMSYAAECKQYSTDAALTVGLLAVALGLLQGKSGLWRWTMLALAGSAAIWFSHPAAFVLGGIGLALFAEAVVRHDRGRITACCATIGCWLTSFALCYLVALRHLGNNQYLLDYWAGHFLPLPRSAGDLAWLADHYFAFFAYPGGLGGTEIKAGGVAAVLFLVGLVAIARDRWTVAVALSLPGILALLASGLHKYPFAGRLLLFLVPPMLLAVARGAWVVFAALRPSRPLAAWLFLGLLAMAPTFEMYQKVRRPFHHEEVAPVLRALQMECQTDDVVYVYYGAVPAFQFYTRNAPLPLTVHLGNAHRDGRTGYWDELQRFAGHPRVWLVFSHRHRNEESVIRAYAEGLGRCNREIRHPGAAAYLFDFSTR